MKSGEHFDVIIIGAGPSGIFCAYELMSRFAQNVTELRAKRN